MSHLRPFAPFRIATIVPLGFIAGLSVLFFNGCRRSTETSGDSVAVANTPVAAAPVTGPEKSAALHAVLSTDKGEIEIEFLPADAPKAVENFRLLSERGYYNGLTFHRIVKGFMLQGGDPLGTGRGGESAWGSVFADEINRNSPLYKGGYKRGLVAMANMGPNTNASQFFIMHQDFPLPPAYVIFAKVIRGMEVVDALANTPTTMGMDGGMSKPVTPPVIRKITLKP